MSYIQLTISKNVDCTSSAYAYWPETFVEKGFSNKAKYTVGRRRNRQRTNLGLLRQGWQRVIEMRTKATACAIHNSLRAQHQPKVRLTHHDDKAGSFYWLKIIATAIAPVSMVNHHLSMEKRLAMVHSYNSNIWSLPCVKFSDISPIYSGETRCHFREVHIIFNGTNHHFEFDFRKKGTWR